MARSKFKKALLTVAVIWAFLVAVAGTYFGLRYGLKMRGEEQVVASTYDAMGHVMGDGLKYIYYKTMVWGTVVADFEDFRAKVAETMTGGMTIRWRQ